MKKIIYTALAFLLWSCSQSQNTGDTENLISEGDTIKEFDMNQTRLSAVDFNNEMSFMQDGILSQIDALFESDSSNVDLNLENTLFEIELNMESLENMKTPDKGEPFVTAMKNLMLFYRAELTGNFQSIVPLLKKAEWTKKDEKFVNDYDLNFVTLEKTWFDSVFVEQEKFAAANNIKLEESGK